VGPQQRQSECWACADSPAASRFRKAPAGRRGVLSEIGLSFLLGLVPACTSCRPPVVGRAVWVADEGGRELSSRVREYRAPGRLP
jgi:hypothetical protein